MSNKKSNIYKYILLVKCWIFSQSHPWKLIVDYTLFFWIFMDLNKNMNRTQSLNKIYFYKRAFTVPVQYKLNVYDLWKLATCTTVLTRIATDMEVFFSYFRF